MTFAVSKLLTSIEANDLQPINILVIAVTLDVSKDDKSTLVKLSQPLNIFDIPVTLEVSNLLRSKDVSFLQFANIHSILFAPAALKSPKLILVKFSQP